MMSMQFWSKVVKQQSNWRVRLLQTGWVLILVSVFAAKLPVGLGKARELSGVGALVGLGVAIVGTILTRRNKATALITDTDIIVSIEEIRIGEQRFRVSEIDYLDFLVNSYDGMPGPRASPRGGIFGLLAGKRIVLNGCDNKLLFMADGKQHSYPFYLEDEMAMRRLGMLFREFYSKGLRFRERNRGGRTFLFEQVMDKHAFERAKQAEGYL